MDEGISCTRGQVKGRDNINLVCQGIALAGSELPMEMTGRHDLARRIYVRGEQLEYRFLLHDRMAKLPIWRDGQHQIVYWGNRRGRSRYLPRTGWTWQATIEEGGWKGLGAIPVDIPATFALDRGIWYRERQGIRGVLVPDEKGIAVVYLICEPASHYYRVMTRNDRMPVLIQERI